MDVVRVTAVDDNPRLCSPAIWQSNDYCHFVDW